MNDWFVHYRIYHPNGTSKQVRVKGKLNKIMSWSERVRAVKALRDFEEDRLRSPTSLPEEAMIQGDILPTTPLEQALETAYTKLKLCREAMTDVRSVKKGFVHAAKRLRLADTPISQVTRKYIKLILENCEQNNPRWTNNAFNNYLRYLRALFNEISEMEAIDGNPMLNFKKKTVIRKIPVLLTDKEREKIDVFLSEHFPTFRRFIQIFFHSGGRVTELLRLKVKDVDLVKQTYTIIVRKGSTPHESQRPIVDVVLPFWKDLLKDAKSTDYAFSKNLEPGKDAIRREQVTRRWEEHVKGKLKIKADLYKLKHLHTTEVADALGDKEAARMNGHLTTTMVNKVYDRRYEARKDEELKSLTISFVPGTLTAV